MASRKLHKAKLAASSAKMVTQAAPVEIKAGEGENPGPPSFSSIAYDGTKPVPGYTASPRLDAPYVLNLAGMKQGRSPKANLDHKANQRVGHLTDFVNDGSKVSVSGVLSAASPHRDEVAQSAAQGFGWEVSIEASMEGRRKIPAGKTVQVNGVTLAGPLYVFDRSTLTDLAFVSHGANEGNQVTIAASAAKEEPMNEFEKFAASLGVDLEAATDEVKANLQELFKSKQAHHQPSGPGKTLAELAEVERQNNARIERINEISVAAMKEHPMYIDQIKALGQMAIDNKSNPDMYELELIRHTRSKAGTFSVHMGSRSKPDGKVIEAAICMMAGLPDIEKHYSEQTLDAVDRSGMRYNFSLQGLLFQVAGENGYHCRAGERITVGNIREVLQYAFMPTYARMSGFSTISLPGILGNVANKMILAGYMEEDPTWQEIAAVRNVSNFYQHTHYRMLDNLEYEEIGSGGEIPHGNLGQESYTSQAKTYGKMLGITRTQIINDDLGAFDDIRTRLGRGAAQKFNNVFWARFMSNLATMFPTDKSLGNYIDGTPGSVLGVDGVGLQAGITAYRKLRSPAADGQKRVGVSTSPSILVVPPELEFNAQRLYQSTNVNTGGAATAETVGNANIHAGRYRPVVQNRLSDTGFTGNSTTAWYLFGAQLKPMLVTFLNGNRTPIIESSDADFDTLGIQFRGYHDFGCDPAEYLAGIMSKGAAA